MKFLYYSGQGIQRKQGSSDIPTSRVSDNTDPEKYLADSGLVDAANVAIMLGQPLLLTGEPGTGKTQFANSLAWELKLGKPWKFNTKSNSTARDLFYTYDALKRFQDIQSGVKSDGALPYLNYQALGIAILRTRLWADNKDLVVNDKLKPNEPTRSVVLIDEIDKAPRDFPNDILNEIESMFFSIPEIGKEVIANPKLPPIVVITSNSEKDLPDAFLRRCVYYHIPFPEKDQLRLIVDKRLGSVVKGMDGFIDKALDLFTELRPPAVQLRKSPSTAELLGWMLLLKNMAPDKADPLANEDLVNLTLPNLIKDSQDIKRATEIIEQWMKKPA